MKTALALSFLALAGSSTYVLAPDGAAAPAARRTTASAYTVDPSHSGVIFRIEHMGVAPFYGRFNRIGGEYVLDREDPAGCSITVEIDAESVDTNSEDRDKHLCSPDFFNVKEYPKIRFESTKVGSDGEGRYRVTGDLSFHGVTKEVVIEARLIGEADTRMGPKSGFEGELVIDRNDFDVKTYPGALGDEVKLILFLEGNRKE